MRKLMPISNVVGKMKSETVRIISTVPAHRRHNLTVCSFQLMVSKDARKSDLEKQGPGHFHKVNDVKQICWCLAS